MYHHARPTGSFMVTLLMDTSEICDSVWYLLSGSQQGEHTKILEHRSKQSICCALGVCCYSVLVPLELHTRMSDSHTSTGVERSIQWCLLFSFRVVEVELVRAGHVALWQCTCLGCVSSWSIPSTSKIDK